MRRFIVAAAAAFVLSVLPAPAASLVNKDGAALGVQGYDPVAFFTEGKPVAGLPSISFVLDGATYRFATEADRAAFQKDPAKYAPAFGGYCAFGVAHGGLAPVQIGTWQILDGRLVLNNSPEVKAMFDKD